MKNKNRVNDVTQIFQAITTLVIISLIYLSSNIFASNNSTFAESKPSEMQNYPQVNYWNNDFGYGFSSQKNDKITNKTLSWVDQVAVDIREGIIFEDAKVKVSYYPTLTMSEVEKRHTENISRAYSRLNSGIAVIEGDLDSNSAKIILATLYSR